MAPALRVLLGVRTAFKLYIPDREVADVDVCGVNNVDYYNSMVSIQTKGLGVAYITQPTRMRSRSQRRWWSGPSGSIEHVRGCRGYYLEHRW